MMTLNFQSLTNLAKTMNRDLLLAGALLGGAAAACDAKTIGDETSGNVICEEGDSKDAGDDCNTCTCMGGEWACTEKGCGECVDGAVKDADDDCNTCTCYDGAWQCTEIGCPGTGGPGALCGDGIVGEGEECDDGNDVNGDGCDANCTFGGGAETESGTDGEPDTTGGEPDTTGGEGLCGNGVVEAGEQCDDGNNVDGDGCSVGCVLEGGGPLFCAEPVAADPFAILSAMLVGDALAVEVQYGGGCAEHVFSYCWDGLFLESEPVQIHTKISHDGNDDPCDAAPVEALEFDLSDLKQAYQDGYQTQNGEITIHLDGWDQSLAYVF